MFELYQAEEKTCPEYVVIEGISIKINADFRNILKIFAMLNDKNIPQFVRVQKLTEWFFKDYEEIPPEEAINIFTNFINPPVEKTLWLGEEDLGGDDFEEREKQFDYYFDSEEIYAGFLSEYNINLIRVDFLHWYEFNILLKNLSKESTFKKKIELRFLDLGIYSGNNQAFSKMAQAKRSVQLPVELSEEELREIEEFDDVWGRI